MRPFRHVLLLCTVILSASAFRLAAAGTALRPDGKILFQPQLLWSNSMTTVEGTGYVIEHDGKSFGVTSVHYLNFNAGGLRAATWLDVYSGRPLATFRSSLGRPARIAITRPQHVADDFLLLPSIMPPEEGTPLQLEQVERYSPGTRLWFPHKNRELEAGYEWIDATVIEDVGYSITTRLRDPITLESAGGSPVLNAATGKVVGMVRGSADENGKIVLTLCPARSLLKHLARRPQAMPLMTSISRRR